MKRVFFILVVAVLAVSLLLGACAKEVTTQSTSNTTTNTSSTTVTQSSSTTTESTTTQSSKTIKIGVLGYLGGTQGVDSLRALELMADLDNNKGGWNIGGEPYQIKIIGYDNKLDQATEVAAVNRMIFEDKVNFILSQGQFQSSWIPVAEKAKIVTFVTVDMTNMGLKPDYHYFFSADFINGQMSSFIGWFAKQYPDVQNNLVIGLPDNQIGHMLSMILGSMANHFGVTPKDIYFPATATDLSALGTQVVQANPKYFTTMGGSDAGDGQVFNAVSLAGYKGMMFAPTQISSFVLSQTLSQQALEGFFCMASPTEFDPPPTQEAKDIKDAWIKKYGDWTEPSISMVDDYLALKTAVEQAGSLDPDKIAGILSNGMKYDSLNGPSQMVSRPDLGNDRTVDSVSTFYIKQIRNGKAELLSTVSPDEAKAYMSAIPQLPPGPPPGGLPPGGPPPGP
jgi:ABC-type branched-subunit amino acid transport system substrate-binding protein